MQFAIANIASDSVAQNLGLFATLGRSAECRLDRFGRMGLRRRSYFSDVAVQAGTDRGGDDAQNTYQADPHGSPLSQMGVADTNRLTHRQNIAHVMAVQRC